MKNKSLKNKSIKRKIIKNNKAQFFVASAVIMIITITGIFFYISQVENLDSSSLFVQDEGFLMNNIRNEYEQTAEIALSTFSRDGTASVGFLTNSMTNLTELVRNISSQHGMTFTISTTQNTVTNETVNVSVSIRSVIEGRQTYLDFDAVSQINVTLDNGTISTSPNCGFDFSVKKEYAEPILNLNNTTSFAAKINTTVCNQLLISEQGSGIYTASCTGQTCVNSLVIITVTDFRNIYGYDRWEGA